MIKPKILISQTINGAHESLNKERKIRYNLRLRRAIELNLNFRFNGNPIKRRINNHCGYTDNAKCLCCGKSRHECICKIEVQKQDPFYANNPTPRYDNTLSKISNNELFIIRD